MGTNLQSHNAICPDVQSIFLMDNPMLPREFLPFPFAFASPILHVPEIFTISSLHVFPILSLFSRGTEGSSLSHFTMASSEISSDDCDIVDSVYIALDTSRYC